jgi:hypothetical protein
MGTHSGNFGTHFLPIASKAQDRHCGGIHMKTRSVLIGSLLYCLLAASSSVAAHHSWSGYDMSNLITVKGTVTEFDWGNPHMWVYFEAMDDKGNVEKWSAGGPGPNRLANTGWNKDTLKLGDQITFVGHRLKDGTLGMRLEKVVLADGRELPCYRGR